MRAEPVLNASKYVAGLRLIALGLLGVKEECALLRAAQKAPTAVLAFGKVNDRIPPVFKGYGLRAARADAVVATAGAFPCKTDTLHDGDGPKHNLGFGYFCQCACWAGTYALHTSDTFGCFQNGRAEVTRPVSPVPRMDGTGSAYVKTPHTTCAPGKKSFLNQRTGRAGQIFCPYNAHGAT